MTGKNLTVQVWVPDGLTSTEFVLTYLREVITQLMVWAKANLKD